MSYEKIIRLDKYLSDMKLGTRSEVKNYIKKGRVEVNGEVIKANDFKIKLCSDIVTFDSKDVKYVEYEYYMLNKPQGVISASYDKRDSTVVELITGRVREDLFPIGRLDKDTEGLLIITNDGALTHNLLSPKKHIPKTYFAKIEGKVIEEDVLAFSNGVYIEEDLKTLPSTLKIINSGEISEIYLTIYEGKFHQVKRMFEAIGKKVVYLKRISMGSLNLDENLSLGEYRPLTIEEINSLKQN